MFGPQAAIALLAAVCVLCGVCASPRERAHVLCFYARCSNTYTHTHTRTVVFIVLLFELDGDGLCGSHVYTFSWLHKRTTQSTLAGKCEMLAVFALLLFGQHSRKHFGINHSPRAKAYMSVVCKHANTQTRHSAKDGKIARSLARLLCPSIDAGGCCVCERDE